MFDHDDRTSIIGRAGTTGGTPSVGGSQGSCRRRQDGGKRHTVEIVAFDDNGASSDGLENNADAGMVSHPPW